MALVNQMESTLEEYLDIIRGLTLKHAKTPERAAIKKRITPVFQQAQEASAKLRAAHADEEKPSEWVNQVAKQAAASNRRTDQFGIPNDCYRQIRGEDMSRGLREVARLGRNPEFAKTVHLVREILLVAPQASAAFMTFLAKCRDVATDLPSFESSSLRLENRFHGFRLYALITRDPEYPGSTEYLNVKELREHLAGGAYDPRSRYHKEVKLLLPLFFSLEGYNTMLSPGAWEVFLEHPSTNDDEKSLEAQAKQNPLSEASLIVVERAKRARMFRYLPDEVRCGVAIRDPLQARKALDESLARAQEVEDSAGANARTETGQHPHGPGVYSGRSEPAIKRNRAETGNRPTRGEPRRELYNVVVNGRTIPVPSPGERSRAVRHRGLCRFCGHSGHVNKLHSDTKECPVNGNSEHFNPGDPWEYAYLVAIGERSPK